MRLATLKSMTSPISTKIQRVNLTSACELPSEQEVEEQRHPAKISNLAGQKVGGLLSPEDKYVVQADKEEERKLQQLKKNLRQAAMIKEVNKTDKKFLAMIGRNLGKDYTF